MAMGYCARKRQLKRGIKKLGLVFSSSSMRLLEVTVFSAEHIEISAFAYISFSDKNLVQGMHDAQLDLVLMQALADQAITTQAVSLAISLEQVVMRSMMVSAILSPIELDTLIEHTIEQYIPYRREDIYYDYYHDLSIKTENNTTQVHLVAARSESVNWQLDIVRKAGLKTQNVDIDIFAIQRALQYRMCVTGAHAHSWTNQSFFLLEIDKVLLRIFLVSPAASQVLWKGSTRLLVDMRQDEICSIVQRSLRLLHQESPHYAKYEIVLIGENTNNDMAACLQQGMKVPTSLLDPFIGFSQRAGLHPQTLQKIAPMMLIPVGLVLGKG